jgi:hypothetical protein
MQGIDIHASTHTPSHAVPNPVSGPAGTEANTKHSLSAQHYRTNADGTAGFVSVMACVTKPGVAHHTTHTAAVSCSLELHPPDRQAEHNVTLCSACLHPTTGYGMTGRGAQKCDPGAYSPGNSYAPCQKCPFGYTTFGAGLGITAADCVTDLGYGLVNGAMGECPIGECCCPQRPQKDACMSYHTLLLMWSCVLFYAGTYADERTKNASLSCKSCPRGRTTSGPGADALSDCQLCSECRRHK